MECPVKVNHGSVTTTAIFLDSRGQVDVVYYATPAGANYQSCGQTGTYNRNNEPWSVFFSQNRHVLTGGTWTQVKATPVVHHGGVGQGGVACASNGPRQPRSLR